MRLYCLQPSSAPSPCNPICSSYIPARGPSSAVVPSARNSAVPACVTQTHPITTSCPNPEGRDTVNSSFLTNPI